MNRRVNIINTYSIMTVVMVLISIVGFYLGDVLVDTSTLTATTMILERIVFGLLTVTSISALIFGCIAIYKTPDWSTRAFLAVIFIVGIIALGLNGSTLLLSGFTVPF